MDIDMTKAPEGELLSPEGVEERLVVQMTFQVRLTQGGKYRVYGTVAPKAKLEPHGPVVDDQKVAEKAMGEMMGVAGMLLADPERTINALLDGLKKKSS